MAQQAEARMRWEELYMWHNVPAPEPFMERFTKEALEGWEPHDPIMFKVIRDEWFVDADGLKRLIHEVEFLEPIGEQEHGATG